MAKLISYILTIVILFQNLNAQSSDFEKLPILFNHLVSHLQEGDSISDFLAMHYGDNMLEHSEDHQEHKKLPFKHQNPDSHFQLVYVLTILNFPLDSLEFEIEKQEFFYKEPVGSSIFKNLFQPPRLA